jgi:hypothetical protein
MNHDSSVKKTRLHCLIGNCLPPTKPYDAHDWEENQCKVEELADQTRAIGFSQFLRECGDYDCLP